MVQMHQLLINQSDSKEILFLSLSNLKFLLSLSLHRFLTTAVALSLSFLLFSQTKPPWPILLLVASKSYKHHSEGSLKPKPFDLSSSLSLSDLRLSLAASLSTQTVLSLFFWFLCYGRKLLPLGLVSIGDLCGF